QGQSFRVVSDIHQPEPGGQPAPYVDGKGWHHNDPNQPVVFHAGEDVQIAGVFNYGDRGFFLQIESPARKTEAGAPVHVRVRFVAEAPPEKPDVQETELQGLVARVLRAAAR